MFHHETPYEQGLRLLSEGIGMLQTAQAIPDEPDGTVELAFHRRRVARVEDVKMKVTGRIPNLLRREGDNDGRGNS